jgi:type VI secretion system protein ImpL
VRRQQGIRYGAMAAITLGTVLLLGAWGWSFINNRDLLQQTNTFISDYKVSAAPQLDQTSVSDTDLMSVLPALDQLRDNPVGYGNRDEGTPLGEGFGLSQRDRLVEASAVTYRGALERLLRSRLILRLENQLNAAADDPLASYEALKVYLMLGGKAPKTDADFIVAWMKQDWANLYPGPANRSARDDLEQHLRAMLALDVARRPSFELNGLLVDSVQRRLTRLSIADQAYAYLKTAVPDVPLEDFNVAARSGPESAEVFETVDGSDFATLKVPALFTYNGFHGFFLPHLAGVAEQLLSEQWVRGDLGKQDTSEEQIRQLGPQLLALYSKDFVDAWTKVLNDIRLKPLPGEKPEYTQLSVASNPQTSPLKALVEAIVAETSLTKDTTPDAGSTAGAGAGAAGGLGKLGEDVKKYEAQQLQARAGGLARIGIGFALNNKTSGRPGDNSSPAQAIPGADVEAQFKNYALLLDGQPRAIDVMLQSLNEIYRNLTIAAHDPSQAATANSAVELNVANLSISASRFPDPLHRMIDGAVQDLEGNAADTSLAQLRDKFGNQVSRICQTLTSNLYPFAAGSKRDLPMGDFARLFAPNGIMDKFFAENLSPMVDMSGKLWAWKQDSALGRQLSNASLRQFQRAAEIRDAFFPPNSQVPQVTLTISPMTLNAAAQTATLNIDGTNIVSQQVGSVPVTLQWPNPNGTGGVSLTMAPEMQGRPSTFSLQGPWALMRLLGMGSVSQSGGTMRAQFVLGGRDVSYSIQVGTLANPFFLPALSQFSCPTGL